jgi:hypothetical protein
MRIQYFLLLIVFSLSAQKNPIEIKIDSITSKDSSEFLDREFTINYQIENLTNNEVSFFLNIKNFIPSTFSSMQYVPTYRLFQNENPIDASQIIKGKRMYFRSNINNQKAFKESLKINQDSIKLEIQKWKSDSLYFWKKKNRALLNAVFTLKPKEIKQFTQKIYWNKIRYTKNDELEYYFDEKSLYYLQIEFILMKKQFEDRLTQKELESILANPNYIEGYFHSNKVEMNFKE